jgi:hypothetical protein
MFLPDARFMSDLRVCPSHSEHRVFDSPSLVRVGSKFCVYLFMETLVAIIYFTVQGTTPGGRFLRSASHRAVQAEIFALSKFTVATSRAKP